MILGYCRVQTQDQAADNRTSLDEQERIIRGVAMIRGVDKMDVSLSTRIPASPAPCRCAFAPRAKSFSTR